MTSVLTKHQSTARSKVLPNGHKLEVRLRYDDECGNGHNTFAITGSVYRPQYHGIGFYQEPYECGCLHELIAEHFPEYAPLIKWHLCSSDGPMHYYEDTLFHAGNRDPWGLLKGQVVGGRTGEGKERDLAAARQSAVWPDATDEELMAEDLRGRLEERLPALLDEFRKAIESLGFVY